MFPKVHCHSAKEDQLNIQEIIVIRGLMLNLLNEKQESSLSDFSDYSGNFCRVSLDIITYYYDINVDFMGSVQKHL